MIQFDENVSTAYRVGFKAGFDECLKIVEENQALMEGEPVFDRVTLASVRIILISLREHVEKHGELNINE